MGRLANESNYLAAREKDFRRRAGTVIIGLTQEMNFAPLNAIFLMTYSTANIGRAGLALAVATGAGWVGAPSADAQIIYSGPVSLAIPATSAGLYLNVVTGVSNTNPGLVPGWDINPFGTSGLSWFAAAPNGSHGTIVNAAGGLSATLVDYLAVGTPISAAAAFGANNASETNGPTALTLNSSNNYVGFRFLDQGGTLRFGWAQVQLGATQSDPVRRIIGYAYESTGTSINAGDTGAVAVPEPGTYLVGFAAGALALRAWRRRQAAQAA